MFFESFMPVLRATRSSELQQPRLLSQVWYLYFCLEEAILILRSSVEKEKFFSFTTKDLLELDVISLRSFKKCNLINPIVPFLRRNQWDNGTHAHKVAFDSKGPFTAHHPTVWTLLEPVLILASRMLTVRM